MRKFIKLLAFFVAGLSIVIIQSCDNEDPKPAPPTLTAPSGIASVQVGTSGDVTFTFDAPGKFASSEVTSVTGGTAVVKTEGTNGATSGSVVVAFTAGNSAGAGAVELTIKDASNQEVKATAILNVSISAPPTITLDQSELSGFPGGSVVVTATVTAANGAKNITITGADTDPASPIALSNESSAVQKEVTVYIPSDAVIGSNFNVVFTAADNQNLFSTTANLKVNVITNTLTGDLTSNMTIAKGQPYLITGQFRVKSGVTLTVEPGAIVKGDKASKGVLIIEPGGILMAEGTEAEPIVFTSSQPAGERDRGDWGGIVWLGNAYVNQASKPNVEGISPSLAYGTVDGSQADATVGANTENNGVLKYARIEYAGIELTPNNETNGLTMGALGSGTTIEYVQSSYGGDDAFEWFGGTVNAKHLIALATWDDDFDTDFGWRGMVQFGVSVRAPFVADQSGSTSFESDSQGNGNPIGTVCTSTAGQQGGCTQGVFSNMTILGPRDYTRSISGNFTRAMHIRRRTAISIFNSVITGYPTGLTMDDQGTIDNYTAGAGVFKNNVLFQPILPNSVTNSAFASGNAYYSSNVAGATSGTGGASGTISGFWEPANTIVKGSVITKANGDFASNWAATASAADNIINPYTGTGLETAPFYAGQTSASYPSNPSFAVAGGSITGLNASDLFPASSKVDNAFFDKTITYQGAFGITDWTDGWSEFQPLTKAY